jgi:hypothetical protein
MNLAGVSAPVSKTGRSLPIWITTLPGALDEDCYGAVRTFLRRDIDGRAVRIPSKRPAEYRRLLGGRIVIFPKSSPYNLESGTDDGWHNRMGRKLFRQYIQSAINSSPFGAETYQASGSCLEVTSTVEAEI